MQPSGFGRKVGVGVRVASGILRDRAIQASQAAQTEAPAYARRSQTVGRGIKRFGQSLLGPVVHAGSVLWLEITGSFFTLFALFFLQHLFELRHQWYSGPRHRQFFVYALCGMLFLYFACSSFYRARTRSRKTRRS